MKTRRIAVLAALAGGIGLSALVAEDVPANKLYQDLANKNRYPAAEGLASAQADVKCSIADQIIGAFPDAAGKPIAAKYSWERPSQEAPPQMKFTVSGVPENLADLTTRLNTVYQRATEFVITPPIYWTFADMDVKAASEGGKIAVTATPKNASAQVKGATAEVDAASYQVKAMVLDLGQAKIQFDMTSKDLGGKWGVETYTLTFPQYKQTWTYEYTQVDGFWLPSKMSLDLKGPDGSAIEPTSVYEFTNWQVKKAG